MTFSYADRFYHVICSSLKDLSFRGGQPTPILDIRGAARLWACLPGARASAFRATIVDTWIRVFGGDETLIDEIRRNREIQAQLPADHAGRVFGDAVAERNDHSSSVTQVPSETRMALTMPDVQAIIVRAVQTALQPLHDRIEQEIAARLELENRTRQDLADANTRLHEQAAILTTTQLVSERLSQSLIASETRANELAVEIAGIRTAQCVRYRAEAFDDIQTLENFIASPATTAVRFKDLFRFMGIIGVKEEISMACGRKTHQLAPGIGHRKQRGRDGREYVTVDYRKSQASVMLRGIMAVCYEHDHLMETEDGHRCICRECRNLMNALRR